MGSTDLCAGVRSDESPAGSTAVQVAGICQPRESGTCGADRTNDGPAFKVIIPSARAANLIPCVRSLVENEADLRPRDIIVVDDGARQGGEGALPGISWLRGVKPFVFSRNVNLGIREAGTDVVVVNDDARLLTPGGLTLLANGMRARPDVGVCSAGIRGVIANPNQLVTGRGEWREEPGSLAFVCVYIPKAVYDEVGPLDERFTGYGFDDNDYCARVAAAGLRLMIWDGCVVDHGGELPSSFRTRADIESLFVLNQRRFQAKWGRSA